TLPVHEVTLAPTTDGDTPAQLLAACPASMDIRLAPMLDVPITPAPRDADGDRWLLALRTHHLTRDHQALEILLAAVRAHLEHQEAGLAEPAPYRDFVAYSR
ncbi:hypothetical protein, partial [Streptomyces sp. JV184]|uniref:hypothetical protein n=1 Tax=Streptomyces sp. JV184 TaxID=858637 RepID=UPI002E79A7C9